MEKGENCCVKDIGCADTVLQALSWLPHSFHNNPVNVKKHVLPLLFYWWGNQRISKWLARNHIRISGVQLEFKSRTALLGVWGFTTTLHPHSRAKSQVPCQMVTLPVGRLLLWGPDGIPQRTIWEVNGFLLQSIVIPGGHLPVVISLLEPFSVIAKSYWRLHYCFLWQIYEGLIGGGWGGWVGNYTENGRVVSADTSANCISSISVEILGSMLYKEAKPRGARRQTETVQSECGHINPCFHSRQISLPTHHICLFRGTGTGIIWLDQVTLYKLVSLWPPRGV